MGKYYDIIMNPTNNSFAQHFNKCWQNQLEKLAKPYSDAIQLRIGNQLRPKLTCWGAAFNTNCVDEIDLVRTSEIASYIEMLHKASIIIDDMVDNDDARHGKKSFHVEFGRDKAIMFALVLLGKGMNGINEVFKKSKIHYQSMEIYSETIYRMAMGCLEELELDSSSRYDVDKIRRIISLETITLIKNSFLLGYWSNCRTEYAIEETIVEIGRNCGYIFQILNDLEPFSSLEKNTAYKGGQNLDVNRDRKNIVVAYIFGAASSKEKQALLKLFGEELQILIWELYQKYDVYEAICNNARTLEQQTDRLIDKLQQRNIYVSSIDDFRVFVHEMVSICFSKLG